MWRLWLTCDNSRAAQLTFFTVWRFGVACIHHLPSPSNNTVHRGHNQPMEYQHKSFEYRIGIFSTIVVVNMNNGWQNHLYSLSLILCIEKKMIRTSHEIALFKVYLYLYQIGLMFKSKCVCCREERVCGRVLASVWRNCRTVAYNESLCCVFYMSYNSYRGCSTMNDDSRASFESSTITFRLGAFTTASTISDMTSCPRISHSSRFFMA